MINSPDVLRVLRPKVTQAALLRMHQQNLLDIAVAWVTLPLEVAAVFYGTWAAVYEPRGRK